MKPMRSRKLFWHYGFLLAVILISFLALTIYLERRTRTLFIRQNRQLIKRAGELLTSSFPPVLFDTPQAADSYVKSLAADSQFRLTVVLPDGKVIADSHNDTTLMNNHLDRPEIQFAEDYGTGTSIRTSATQGIRFLYIAYAVPAPGSAALRGFFRVAIPIQELFHITRNLSISFAVSGFIIFAVLTVFSLLSFRRIIGSIKELQTAAKEYASGNLEYKARVENPEEMQILRKAMQSMSKDLQRHIDTILEQKGELEAILSNMAEGVILLDHTLIIKSINQAAADLIDRKKAELEGRSLIEVFRNTHLYDFAKNALAAGENDEITISINRGYPAQPRGVTGGSGGTKQLFLRVMSSLVHFPRRERPHLLLVLHEMTKDILIEKMRKDFVANVSHELKTPITSIKGFVETLLSGGLEDKIQADRFLTIVAKHTNRLNSIIDDLLTLSKLDEIEKDDIKKTKCSIRSIIGNAAQACAGDAEQREIEIDVSINEDVEISVNARLVEQAIINLLENAIKYSEPNKTVGIETKIQDDRFIEIAVADQGYGIPKDSIDRIFERFYRVDSARSRELGGTGLGLAIVKHIALTHGGIVRVSSAVGQGSTFSLVLPLGDAAYNRTPL